VGARRQLGDWRAALRRYPAAVAASLAGIFGFLWWLGIAVETQAGFAGNPRYAVIGVMFVCIAGCVAYGWACVGLATLAARTWPWLRRRSHRSGATRSLFAARSQGRRSSGEPAASQWTLLAAAATLVVTVVFAVVPSQFTTRMPTVRSIHANIDYQAHLRNEITELVRRAGGARKVVGCGSVMAHNLQVTMVAWSLGVPIPWIQALPRKFSNDRGPNVVFQDGPTSTRASNQGPSSAQMQAWETGWKQYNGSRYTIMKAPAVTLYMNCSAYSKT
jgi:hypothetical protein